MSDIFGDLSKAVNSKEEEKLVLLRVDGGGSPINDRRNWDGYIVIKL